ncbi:hypothetical protein [Undibacterium sp. Di24W]|uniref:hypothetical protein n=1 Tax=Undibacterium sp. Di24W TaxID=3413033 RepID=UPI003BF2D9A0
MKLSSKIHRFLLILVCIIGLNQLAQADEFDYVRVSEALFPESRTWLNIGRAPTLPASQFQQVKNKLKQSYLAAISTSDPFEGQDCSFIQRSLEPSEIKSFYLLDIDHDGIVDIVYIGSAQCAEGGATVIWYGTQNGFAVRSPAVFPLRLLRVSSDGGRALSVSEGCCGDPVDKYHTGSLSNLRDGDTIPFLHDTVLPRSSLDRSFHFVARREVKLRLAPKINDQYDQGLSEFLNRAAFGNVLRSYLKNSKGVALASVVEYGQKWYFVVMAAESNALASHDPYLGVRAGWLLASEVNVLGHHERL